ncbi:hypothetical protein HY095_04605 [Candidatus Micrarchaeota archaeon]|nr:hypothetical protein [Candidatus Micrarchaeota archaeon]
MDNLKNRFIVRKLALAACVALLLAGNAAADGGGNACGHDCKGDFICMLESIGEQAYCIISDKFHSIAGGAINALYGVIFSYSLLTPSFDDAATAFYQQIVYVAESIMLAVLMLSGVRLIYSSLLSAGERMEAKLEAQRAAANMLLIGLAMPLYLLASDVARAVAAAVGPSQAEFESAALATLVTIPVWGFLFAGLLALALLLSAVLASFRFVLAFIGLFLLPFALAFESFWVTAGIGRTLKLLIATNFVVQILQSLFLKLFVFAIGSGRTLYPAHLELFTATGVLLFATWVTCKLYANAFEFHPGSVALNAAVGAPISYYAINAIKPPKGGNDRKENRQTPTMVVAGDYVP